MNAEDKHILLAEEPHMAIQSDGIYAGHPMTFIRTQGCDVGCVYCDSMHTWSPHNEGKVDTGVIPTPESYRFKDLYIKLSHLGSIYWWFTGGEPMLQSEQIKDFIEYTNQWVHPHFGITTAGWKYDADLFSIMDSVIVDIKAPSSKTISKKEVVDQIYESVPAVEFKMIIGNDDDRLYAKDMIDSYTDVDWLLQPVYGYGQLSPVPNMGTIAEFYDWIKDEFHSYENVRGGIQLHKHIEAEE